MFLVTLRYWEKELNQSQKTDRLTRNSQNGLHLYLMKVLHQRYQ